MGDFVVVLQSSEISVCKLVVMSGQVIATVVFQTIHNNYM